jgi:hypothetical protein
MVGYFLVSNTLKKIVCRYRENSIPLLHVCLSPEDKVNSCEVD